MKKPACYRHLAPGGARNVMEADGSINISSLMGRNLAEPFRTSGGAAAKLYLDVQPHHTPPVNLTVIAALTSAKPLPNSAGSR